MSENANSKPVKQDVVVEEAGRSKQRTSAAKRPGIRVNLTKAVAGQVDSKPSSEVTSRQPEWKLGVDSKSASPTAIDGKAHGAKVTVAPISPSKKPPRPLYQPHSRPQVKDKTDSNARSNVDDGHRPQRSEPRREPDGRQTDREMSNARFRPANSEQSQRFRQDHFRPVPRMIEVKAGNSKAYVSDSKLAAEPSKIGSGRFSDKSEPHASHEPYRGEQSPKRPIVPTNHAPRASEVATEVVRPLFQLEVETPTGAKQRLFIKKDDDPVAVAAEFCTRFEMSDMSDALAYYIDDSKRSLVHKQEQASH